MCDSIEKHNAQTCECTNVVFIFLGLPNFSKTILKHILLILQQHGSKVNVGGVKLAYQQSRPIIHWKIFGKNGLNLLSIYQITMRKHYCSQKHSWWSHFPNTKEQGCSISTVVVVILAACCLHQI